MSVSGYVRNRSHDLSGSFALRMLCAHLLLCSGRVGDFPVRSSTTGTDIVFPF